MDTKVLVRWLLVLVIVAGSAWACLLAISEEISRGGTLALLVVGALAARFLPRGGRLGAWLVAVWAGLAAVLIGQSPPVVAIVGADRWRLAVLGGTSYLMLAGLGFWTCLSRRPRERNADKDTWEP